MDPERYRIGDTVEDFALQDSDGQLRRLSGLAGGGRVVLLFYRGHW
jgi:peroxiredoxin